MLLRQDEFFFILMTVVMLIKRYIISEEEMSYFYGNTDIHSNIIVMRLQTWLDIYASYISEISYWHN